MDTHAVGWRWCTADQVLRSRDRDRLGAAARFSAQIGTPSNDPSGHAPGVQERLGHAEHRRGLTVWGAKLRRVPRWSAVPDRQT